MAKLEVSSTITVYKVRCSACNKPFTSLTNKIRKLVCPHCGYKYNPRSFRNRDGKD